MGMATSFPVVREASSLRGLSPFCSPLELIELRPYWNSIRLAVLNHTTPFCFRGTYHCQYVDVVVMEHTPFDKLPSALVGSHLDPPKIRYFFTDNVDSRTICTTAALLHASKDTLSCLSLSLAHYHSCQLSSSLIRRAINYLTFLRFSAPSVGGILR